MKLLDCTLRDGANVVGNGFNEELSVNIVKALIDCGVDIIEIGNAKGMGAYEDNDAHAPLNDIQYMQAVQPFTEKCEIGMFIQGACVRKSRVKSAAEHGLSFLRVGMTAGNGKEALSAIEAVKEEGLKCRYSLMKAYVIDDSALAKEVKLLEKCGVDAVTLMDSAGTMMPEDVKRYITTVKDKVNIQVGFHGHSNLGLAQANALTAVECGADEIDCGLLGMARSAGNCATELIGALLQKKGLLSNFELYKLLEYLDTYLIPKMKEYDYSPAVKPIDLIFGISGAHSSFTSRFEKIAKEKNVSLYKLITKVSEKDKINPSEDLIRQTADQIKKI